MNEPAPLCLADADLSNADRARPGRKRCEDTRQAILTAAYALLAERGMAHFTIEGVAARAGSAKTTIYRWWPTKGKLAAEAFLASTETRAAVPATGSAIADLKAHMRLLARIFSSPVGAIVAGLIAEGTADPEALETYRQGIIERRRMVSRGILQRGIENGEFRADMKIEPVLDALYSPFYTRILMQFGPLDDAYVEDLVETLLKGIGGSAAAQPAVR